MNINRLEKAAAFGAMMGKRAAGDSLGVTAGQTSLFSGDKPPLPTQPAPPPSRFKYSPAAIPPPTVGPPAPYPSMPFRGGPYNPAGALPGASTHMRLPGGYGPKATNLAMSNNYGNIFNAGYSRHDFHKTLTDQLGKLNKFDDWDKRMGTIADDMSNKAPIRHVEWPGSGYGLPKPDSFDQNITMDPGAKAGHIPSMPPQGYPNNVMTSWRQDPSGRPRNVQFTYAPPISNGRENEFGVTNPASFNTGNNARVHEGTHGGYQKLPNINDYINGMSRGTSYTDAAGKPLNRGDLSIQEEEVARKSGKGNLTPEDEKASTELGVVWNEVGQGARAFKDVTGKHLPGAYNFAPGMAMDYREMADLAKKYKAGDLNAPAGQRFMSQVLRNSRPNNPKNPPVAGK